MTKEQIKLAYSDLLRGGPKAARTYLDTIGKTLFDFADILYERKDITEKQYFDITGKYPPPPPDPQREKAYADWSHALTMGTIKVQQVFGPYPFPGDSRYLKDANNWIRNKLETGQLYDEDLQYLYERGAIEKHEVQDFLAKKGRTHHLSNVLGLPEELIKINLPTETTMLKDRNDVLLIGNRAAGKTMFLASHLFYIQETIRSARILSDVSGSYDYSQRLIAAIAQNKLIDRTHGGTCTNIPLDLRRERASRRNKVQTHVYPLNLTDISGETYQSSFEQGIESLPSNLRSITFSKDNPKILLFTIPVGEYIIRWESRVQAADGSLTTTPSEMLLSGFYSNVLNMFEKYDVLKKTIGIGLIVTKWDKAEFEGFSSVDDFILKKCGAFHKTILDLQKKNGNQYSYKTFTYSISSDLDEKKNRYTHNPKGNDEVYEWLTNTAYESNHK